MNQPLQIHHLILTAVVSVVVSVLTLDYYGYIKHSSPDDTRLTGVYRAIILGDSEEYRMSDKPAPTQARCVQGFMALEFTDNGKPAGILVDDKNRGIRCAMTQ